MTAPKYVSARDGDHNSVIYKLDDGSESLHSGGSRAWRNNNPGNLISAEKSGLAIGKGGNFAVFPDHDTGKKALKFSLTHFYATRKLDEVFKKYAPAADKNDPAHYTQLVKKYTGLDSSRTIGDLNVDELNSFMRAIERVEGWIVGKIEVIPHAQQFEVKAVDGKPLSGIDYVINFFTKNGTEKKIAGKTDNNGKTGVVKTDTKSPVTLKLPRPDPGQSLKGSASGKKTPGIKQVVAAEVKAKPWYEQVFSTAEPSIDAKDNTPTKNIEKKKLVAPTAVVKQTGAIKASGTQKKENNYIEPVIKDPGLFVTWTFDTSGGSGKILNGLPYFIAEINGDVVKPLFEGQQVKLMSGNKIRQKVPFGKEVALFLGSDAKTKYRTKPMYKVKAEEELTDVVVKVLETEGTKYDQLKEIPQDVVVDGTKKTFRAMLFGTTWMNFSHKFTEAEAIESTKGSAAEVQEAVKQIYRGAPDIVGSIITLKVSKPNGNLLKITWPQSAFANCRANIPQIKNASNAKDEVIPRVNPNTYQAFIQAAFDIDAEEMEINSGWRPMLGSVLHRIGVGLDVGSIKLSGHKAQSFSRSETTAERDYKTALKKRIELEKKKNRSAEEDEQLNQLKATEGNKENLASEAIRKSEDDTLKLFTSKLRANNEVRQTFDPWEMDVNTADNITPTQNHLNTGNETLHKTHLHITIFDPELGHGK